MGYTDKFKRQVLDYNKSGYSLSETAKKFGVHKRTVGKWKYKLNPINKQDMPKILIWDVETSETISAHFGMWNISIRPARVLHPSFMFCGAWKWYGEKKIHSTSLLDDMTRFNNNSFDIRDLKFDDYIVVKNLHTALNEADVFVYHNGDKFDLKKFNARASYHGLPPISPNKIRFDTLKVARATYSIESNSLDYLCSYFGIEGKLETPKGMWERALFLEPKAIKQMVKYNERDIFRSLEKIFELLLPHSNKINMNMFTNGYHCASPACMSHDLEFKGYKYTNATRRRQMQCNDCGGWQIVKKSDRTTEIKP
jgi:hypothetical protein